MSRTPVSILIALAFTASLALLAGCDGNSETPDGDQDTILPDGDEAAETTGEETLPGDNETADGDDVEAEDDLPSDEETSACPVSGFAPVKTRAEFGALGTTKDYWIYRAQDQATWPANRLFIGNYLAYGGFSDLGPYALSERETGMSTCGLCMWLYKDCETDSSGQLSCDKILMPRAQGIFDLQAIDRQVGGLFAGTLTGVVFQEVTVADDYTTTPVEGGDTWCLDSFSFSQTTIKAGIVDLEPPGDLSCDYPEGPYYFDGPAWGDSTTEPGVFPPMEWPGAIVAGSDTVGFNVARYRCEHPEIKTLFIMLAAGWCSACRSFYPTEVCSSNGLYKKLKDLNAEVLFVAGEGLRPGTAADNQYANDLMNDYGCTGGIRIADVDNSAGRRVVWGNSMAEGIPWVAAIRMSDMKLTHHTMTINFQILSVAQQNNQD